MFDITNKRIWVAGHRGMVGSAICRALSEEDCEILTSSKEKVDLRNQQQVSDFVKHESPDAIIIAAAVVGGIMANKSYPTQFLYDNLMIEANIIQAAHTNDVDRMVFLGSSCIYPKLAEQPIDEEALLTGTLEESNKWYAIAKIAGIHLIQAYREQYGRDYISAMPTNLYGINDNFDLDSSHVLPALIRKAHEAKINNSDYLTIWGSGKPRREFLNVHDCASAIVFLLKNYSDPQHINVGCGEDISILGLTELVCQIVGFSGKIRLDKSKPDGTPRKLLNVDKLLGLGWSPSIPLPDGIEQTYKWFLENHPKSLLDSRD